MTPASPRSLPAPGETYTVKPGDTLTRIAAAWLGDASRWRELYEANRDRVANPNVVYVGLALRAPGSRTETAQRLRPVGSGWLCDLAREVGTRYGVEPALLLAIVDATSGGDPEAVSAEGARGLMALMPDVARSLGITHPFHPGQSLDGGARFLAFLLRYYNGRLGLALAAYAAGVGTVDRYGDVPPDATIRRFVDAVMAGYAAPVAACGGSVPTLRAA